MQSADGHPTPERGRLRTERVVPETTQPPFFTPLLPDWLRCPAGSVTTSHA